jgi:SHS2 domain-containing protein
MRGLNVPYHFLDDIATADIAFEAWGETAEEMFVAAAEATMNVMVSDLSTIADQEKRTLKVESDTMEMLLFELLQELIFFKDADLLLLRVPRVGIDRRDDHFTLSGEAYGEKIDPQKHDLVVDVKAVTLHRYRVEQTSRGWEAMVILDI